MPPMTPAQPTQDSALGQVSRQIKPHIRIKHPHPFLRHARGDLPMLMHRARVNAVAQLQRQGKHVHICRQRRHFKVAVEHLQHQVPQLQVMLAVGLGHFGEAVLGEDQLPGGGVVAVDGQHAQFHHARQIAPVMQAVVVDGGL